MSDFRINMIRSARLRLGESPREFEKGLKSYLQVRRPLLLFGANRGRGNVYREFKQVLAEGRVVWAGLVMANNGLFQKGSVDAPGIVVHPLHYHVHDDLARLATAAEKVAEFSNERSTRHREEEREFGAVIRNSRGWFASQPVPQSICGEDSLVASSVMFFRKHLPNQVVAANFFPVVVHPAKETVIVLPDHFWPMDLRSYWINPDNR